MTDSDGGVIEDAGVLNANSWDAAALDTSTTSGAPDATAADGSDAATTQDGVWINRTRGTRASGQSWTAVASGTSGEYFVATSATPRPGLIVPGAPPPPPTNLVGGFWTSTNGGLTWTSIGGDDLCSVASNSTGTVLIGAYCNAETSPIWVVTNSGGTWKFKDSLTGIGQISVASDSTGNNLVTGGFFGGDIWTSSNSGASWTDQTPSGPAHGQYWASIASNSTGTKLVAVSQLCCSGDTVGGPGAIGDIWTSADSGVKWTDRTPTGPAHNQYWASVASDSSGMHLVAVGSGIWTSADAGLTWTEQVAPSASWNYGWWISVASDATGKRLIAATAYYALALVSTGNIYTSANGGVTWANETAGTSAEGQNWVGVASDSAGSHLVAVAGGGDVWTH